MSLVGASPCDELALQARPASNPCRPAARPWILLTTILASGMVFVDGTIVNLALPALQHEFHAGVEDVQWVVESYALLLTALLLVGGSAGDRFGRRRIFALGVTVFGIASAWCGMAGSIVELNAARAAQGVGGALLVPGSLALISASFPKSIRGAAIGRWSGYTAILAAIGPVVGGLLIEWYSWRPAFLINIPLVLAILFLTYKFVPESGGNRGPKPLDWQGTTLISIALGCLVYGLIKSSSLGWGNIQVTGPLALVPVSLLAFVLIEQRHPAPMLPLHLFRSRDFTVCNLLTLLLYAALGGSLFFVPLNLIEVHGYSPTAAGAALMPFVLNMFLLSRWSGGLVDRYGARLPLIIGPAIASLGFALFAVPGVGGSYWSTFFPAALVLGMGMAVTVAPLTTTIMNALDLALAGTASGVNNAISRAAALLAIAVFGVVMSGAFNHAMKQELPKLSLSSSVAAQIESQQHRLAAIEVPANATDEERQAIKVTVSSAFVFGFRRIMINAALLALVGSLLVYVFMDKRRIEYS